MLDLLELLGVAISLVEHLAAYVYLAYCVVVGVQTILDRDTVPAEPRFGYPLFLELTEEVEG